MPDVELAEAIAPVKLRSFGRLAPILRASLAARYRKPELEADHRAQLAGQHRLHQQVKVVPFGLALVPADRAAGDHDRRHGAAEGGAQRVDRLDSGMAVPEPVVDDQQLRPRPAGAGRRAPSASTASTLSKLATCAPQPSSSTSRPLRDRGIVFDDDDHPAVQRQRPAAPWPPRSRRPSAPPCPAATRA